MPIPAPLRVYPFGNTDPLALLGDSRQVLYLRRYLSDLGAQAVLEEPYYFDRDYLAEFAAFYCMSATGYPNVCRRLHFFKTPLERSGLESAIDDPEAAGKLAQQYLGFVVLRPIKAAPIGRTVLAYYPEREPNTPRVISPSRRYHCHVAGIELPIDGLAWQQQDTAVGACATIALWSVLHSSALDGQHAIPTTAAVTRAAHRTASLGKRVFPSGGLTIEQLCEAIKEHGLQPIVVPGDLRTAGPEGRAAFSRERFSASCSALVRSGFPVVVLGTLRERANGATVGGHAVCAVGFRSALPPTAPSGDVAHHDADVPIVYVHDDNIGPNVRFAIATDTAGAVYLRPAPPVPIHPPVLPDPTTNYPDLVPANLVVAVPEDLRSSPDAVHSTGLQVAKLLSNALAAAMKPSGRVAPGLVVSTRFCRVRDYLGKELSLRPGTPAGALGRTRLALVEAVSPMSQHIGVIRVGDGGTPLFDFLLDTSDSDSNQSMFAHVLFEPALAAFLDVISQVFGVDLGTRVIMA